MSWTGGPLSLFVTKADGPTPAHDLCNTKNNPLKIVNDVGTPQDRKWAPLGKLCVPEGWLMI